MPFHTFPGVSLFNEDLGDLENFLWGEGFKISQLKKNLKFQMLSLMNVKTNGIFIVLILCPGNKLDGHKEKIGLSLD